MNRQRIIIIGIVWLGVAGIGAMAFKWFYRPAKEAAEHKAVVQAEQDKVSATSADSRYKHHPRIGMDGFPGYAVLRSQEFKNFAARDNIQIRIVPDEADYVARLKALKFGELEMAVFTWGALIQASEELGATPAVGVLVLDETVGADLAVAYESKFPNIDSLNKTDTRFVLMTNSPSETLCRVLMSQFKLNQLPKDPFIEVDSPQALFNHYRNAKLTDPYIYVCWQPWGTKMLDNPNVHTVIDSSRFKGYIVDVLVVNRDYLYKNRDVVKSTISAYLRAVNHHRDKMKELIIADQAALGEGLSDRQATELVAGIVWKNTQENYAHFGTGGKTLQHVEDMIINLTNVLRTTGAIQTDPTKGKPNLLYYPDLMEELASSNFHPGVQPESIRSGTAVLPALTEVAWERLTPIGTLEVPRLVFARGTSRLSESSTAHLDELIKKLKTFPTYYVQVQGDASTRGDLDANRVLALARAKAATEYLTTHGIHANRVRAMAGMPSGATTVNFVLGETPY